MHGVTIVCFLASYALALGLELWHQFRPRPILRLLALLGGCAGLSAQTIYLYVQQPPLVWQSGWMLFLSWVLAIFYLLGAIHHRQQAWGIFVLPLVLGLVALAMVFGIPETASEDVPRSSEFWGPLHALLLFLATVGVCVGFLASLMYLFQAWRLRRKTLPGHGLRLLSLERLEMMNRRAINLAFPLLTAGVLVGVLRMLQEPLAGWTDPRILSTGILWLAFTLLVVLRQGYHLRGRPAAFLTIVTFVLLLCCLALAHPVSQGGSR